MGFRVWVVQGLGTLRVDFKLGAWFRVSRAELRTRWLLGELFVGLHYSLEAFQVLGTEN